MAQVQDPVTASRGRGMPLPGGVASAPWGFSVDDTGRDLTIPAQVATGGVSPDAARMRALAAQNYASGDTAAGLGASLGAGVAQTFYTAATPIRDTESAIGQLGRNVGHFAGGLLGAVAPTHVPQPIAPAATAPVAAPTTLVPVAPSVGGINPAAAAAVPTLASPGVPLPVPAQVAKPVPQQNEFERMAGLPAGSVNQMWAHTPYAERAGLVSSLTGAKGNLETQGAKASVIDEIRKAYTASMAPVPNETETDRIAREARAKDDYFKRLQAQTNPQGALAGLYTGANNFSQ